MFVVFMHCEFPGVTGIAIQAISRFCVQQDGVQCVANVTRGAVIKKKALRIAKITLYAFLFYLAFILLRQAFFHNQDLSVNKVKIVSWLVFNQPFIRAGHLWFLFALLYAYIFYGLLEHFNLRKFAYRLAAVLFVVYICLAQGAHLAGIEIPNKLAY